MARSLGHQVPLGNHSLAQPHLLQRRPLGSSSLTILNLKTFYPNGFPVASAPAVTDTPQRGNEQVQRQVQVPQSPPIQSPSLQSSPPQSPSLQSPSLQSSPSQSHYSAQTVQPDTATDTRSSTDSSNGPQDLQSSSVSNTRAPGAAPFRNHLQRYFTPESPPSPSAVSGTVLSTDSPVEPTLGSAASIAASQDPPNDPVTLQRTADTANGAVIADSTNDQTQPSSRLENLSAASAPTVANDNPASQATTSIPSVNIRRSLGSLRQAEPQAGAQAASFTGTPSTAQPVSTPQPSVDLITNVTASSSAPSTPADIGQFPTSSAKIARKPDFQSILSQRPRSDSSQTASTNVPQHSQIQRQTASGSTASQPLPKASPSSENKPAVTESEQSSVATRSDQAHWPDSAERGPQPAQPDVLSLKADTPAQATIPVSTENASVKPIEASDSGANSTESVPLPVRPNAAANVGKNTAAESGSIQRSITAASGVPIAAQTAPSATDPDRTTDPSEMSESISPQRGQPDPVARTADSSAVTAGASSLRTSRSPSAALQRSAQTPQASISPSSNESLAASISSITDASASQLPVQDTPVKGAPVSNTGDSSQTSRSDRSAAASIERISDGTASTGNVAIRRSEDTSSLSQGSRAVEPTAPLQESSIGTVAAENSTIQRSTETPSRSQGAPAVELPISNEKAAENRAAGPSKVPPEVPQSSEISKVQRSSVETSVDLGTSTDKGSSAIPVSATPGAITSAAESGELSAEIISRTTAPSSDQATVQRAPADAITVANTGDSSQISRSDKAPSVSAEIASESTNPLEDGRIQRSAEVSVSSQDSRTVASATSLRESSTGKAAAENSTIQRSTNTSAPSQDALAVERPISTEKTAETSVAEPSKGQRSSQAPVIQPEASVQRSSVAETAAQPVAADTDGDLPSSALTRSASPVSAELLSAETLSDSKDSTEDGEIRRSAEVSISSQDSRTIEPAASLQESSTGKAAAENSTIQRSTNTSAASQNAPAIELSTSTGKTAKTSVAEPSKGPRFSQVSVIQPSSDEASVQRSSVAETAAQPVAADTEDASTAQPIGDLPSSSPTRSASPVSAEARQLPGNDSETVQRQSISEAEASNHTSLERSTSASYGVALGETGPTSLPIQSNGRTVPNDAEVAGVVSRPVIERRSDDHKTRDNTSAESAPTIQPVTDSAVVSRQAEESSAVPAISTPVGSDSAVLQPSAGSQLPTVSSQAQPSAMVQRTSEGLSVPAASLDSEAGKAIEQSQSETIQQRSASTPVVPLDDPILQRRPDGAPTDRPPIVNPAQVDELTSAADAISPVEPLPAGSDSVQRFVQQPQTSTKATSQAEAFTSISTDSPSFTGQVSSPEQGAGDPVSAIQRSAQSGFEPFSPPMAVGVAGSQSVVNQDEGGEIAPPSPSTQEYSNPIQRSTDTQSRSDTAPLPSDSLSEPATTARQNNRLQRLPDSTVQRFSADGADSDRATTLDTLATASQPVSGQPDGPNPAATQIQRTVEASGHNSQISDLQIRDSQINGSTAATSAGSEVVSPLTMNTVVEPSTPTLNRSSDGQSIPVNPVSPQENTPTPEASASLSQTALPRIQRTVGSSESSWQTDNLVMETSVNGADGSPSASVPAIRGIGDPCPKTVDRAIDSRTVPPVSPVAPSLSANNALTQNDSQPTAETASQSLPEAAPVVRRTPLVDYPEQTGKLAPSISETDSRSTLQPKRVSPSFPSQASVRSPEGSESSASAGQTASVNHDADVNLNRSPQTSRLSAESAETFPATAQAADESYTPQIQRSVGITRPQLPQVLKPLGVLRPLPPLSRSGEPSAPASATSVQRQTDIPSQWSNLESLVNQLQREPSSEPRMDTPQDTSSSDSGAPSPTSDTVQRETDVPPQSQNPFPQQTEGAIPSSWSNLEDLVVNLKADTSTAATPAPSPSQSSSDSSNTALKASTNSQSGTDSQAKSSSSASPSPSPSPAKSASPVTTLAAKPASPPAVTQPAVTVQRKISSNQPVVVQACSDPVSVTAAGASGQNEPDKAKDYSKYLELLAQEVYGLLRQRLSLEQERRGPKYPR